MSYLLNRDSIRKFSEFLFYKRQIKLGQYGSNCRHNKNVLFLLVSDQMNQNNLFLFYPFIQLLHILYLKIRESSDHLLQSKYTKEVYNHIG